MSKTILADVDGFTPLIDDLADSEGLVTAAVFGRMWRFCQMSDGVCRASLEKISEGLGIDRATVQRHADKLCDLGYLRDTTPSLKNRPHIYVDTGKAGIRVSIGVAERNVKNKNVAQSNETVADGNETVAESRLKKVLKTDSKETYLLTSDDEKKLISLFVEKFGFASEYQQMRKTEKMRLLVLAGKVGKDTVRDVIEWAAKKEIHLANRTGLLDSIETAAEDWHKKVKYQKREEKVVRQTNDEIIRKFVYGQ